MEQNKLVTTFDGTKAFRKDCRYINKQFYIKNTQCFLIFNKWYRINSDYIVYDHEKKEYVLKTNKLHYGIIGLKNNTWDFGYFSTNIAKNVKVKTLDDVIICLNEEICINNDYIEICIKDKSFFIDKNKENSFPINKSIPYKKTTKLPYSCSSLIDKSSNYFNSLFFKLKKNFEYNKYILSYADIKGTFGMEFETSSGRIPSRHLYRLGLIPLRDGSISGDEYVTIPFKSTLNNLRALEDISDVLRKYTSFSINNSFHVHIKITKFSKDFFTSAFIINSQLEKELFSLFPKHYEHSQYFKSTGKNYIQKLKSDLLSPYKIQAVDKQQLFNTLYEYYSGGNKYPNSTSIGHPRDIYNDRKWNIGVRYHFVNFIPLLFNGVNTVEYRLHSPTHNIYKILGWLYIINAILQFSLKYKHIILNPEYILPYNLKKLPVNITLLQILKDIYTENSLSYILSKKYIKYRLNLRKKLDDMEDYVGEYELIHDDEFLPV